MKATEKNPLVEVMRKHEADILADWLKEQARAGTHRGDASQEKELRNVSREFLGAMNEALEGGDLAMSGPAWARAREILAGLSSSRASLGYSPSETALFVFSLKQPVFNRLRADIADGARLVEAFWSATTLIDRLGLFTTEAYQKTREEVISRQQRELLEL